MDKLTGDTTIGDAVAKFPEVADVLTGYGLHCVGCHVNAFESLEQGARGHGMDDETIAKMLADANKMIESTQEKESDNQDFTLTDAAAEKIKTFLEKDSANFMRIKVVPGGCSGFMYDFSSEKEKQEGDSVIGHGGISVILDTESMDHLKGSEVDYVDSFQGAGFKIKNPNAKENCGCGKSFA